MTEQICFIKDGFVFCNGIRRNGHLIFKKDGRWFRFPFYQSKKQESPKEVIPTGDSK
jgi:hypothetical protein